MASAAEPPIPHIPDIAAPTATHHAAGRGGSAGLFIFVALLFGVVFHQFITTQQGHQINDFTAHIAYAESIGSVHDIRSPHFLFQALINAIHALGFSYVHSTVALLGIAYGGMALLLARELTRREARSLRQLFVVVPALLIASHVFLVTMPSRNLYWGYFVPVMYTNPTQQLGKFFALWIYLAYAAGVLESRRPGIWLSPGLGVLCVLSALAKPSFLIAFLPAAGICFLRDVYHRRWRHAVVFASGIALPSVAVLAWQARMANAGNGISVLLAPFTVFDLQSTLYKLPLSLAFPLAVAFAARGTPVDRRRFHFLWLFVALSMFYTLGLAESGPSMMAGNFAWTGQTAVFLAYVESAVFLSTLPAGRPPIRLAWAVFAVHVACGVFWYASNFFPEQEAWL